MSANKPLSGNGENVHSMGVKCIKIANISSIADLPFTSKDASLKA